MFRGKITPLSSKYKQGPSRSQESVSSLVVSSDFTKANSANVWHRGIGHLSPTIFKSILKSVNVSTSLVNKISFDE